MQKKIIYTIYFRPENYPGKELCTVYYAPLNFRDIMLATGKLPPDALPGDMANQVLNIFLLVIVFSMVCFVESFKYFYKILFLLQTSYQKYFVSGMYSWTRIFGKRFKRKSCDGMCCSLRFSYFCCGWSRLYVDCPCKMVFRRGLYNPCCLCYCKNVISFK